MFVSNIWRTGAFGLVLAGLAVSTAAQTIDEITQLSREATFRELKEKAGIAPAKAGAPALTAAVASAAAVSAPKPEPTLMGIYGVGRNLVTEIQEDGFTAQYVRGDTTAGGWYVRAVDSKSVDLASSTGKGKKGRQIHLTFGSKVVDARPAGITTVSMPPLPAGIPSLR
jgi:hypothetical protein